MSRLTEEFLYKLVIHGRTEKEASHILATLVTESIKELYIAKNLDKQSAQALENKLQNLISSGTSENQLFETLGVTPADLEKKLKEKINNYHSTPYASSS